MAGPVLAFKIRAGVVEFYEDLTKAETRVRTFGQTQAKSFQEASQHSVTAVQATSGALRVLEGGMNNNLRAAERFAANVLGLGPVLQAAFPVIGAIAFAGLLVKMGEEAQKFYRDVVYASDKMRGGFEDLQGSLRRTNDQLDLSNAKLENQLAKLEGRHENTLKIALLEARDAADELAQSLDKDLVAMGKVLEENKSTMAQQFFGRLSDKGLREMIIGPDGAGGFGGFRGDIRHTTDEGRAAIQSSIDNKDKEGADAAIEDLKRKLEKKYRDMNDALDRQMVGLPAGGVTIWKYNGAYSEAVNDAAYKVADANKAMVEEINYVKSLLSEEARSIPAQVDKYRLTSAVEKAQAEKHEGRQELPFDREIGQLQARAEGLAKELETVWDSEPAQNYAKAVREAGQAVASIEAHMRSMNQHTAGLSENQKDQLESLFIATATDQEELKLEQHVRETSRAMDVKTIAAEKMADALSKGYVAVREVNAQLKIMELLKPENALSPEFMNNPANQKVIRIATESAYESVDQAHFDSVSKTVEKLKEQAIVEREAAASQLQGAEAVRLAAFNAKLAQIAKDNDIEETKKLTAAERELYAATRLNATNEEVARIEEKTQATQRLAAAIIFGTEAARKANLENQIAEIIRTSSMSDPLGLFGGAMDPRIGAATQASSTDKIYQGQQKVASLDRVQKIDDEIAELKSATTTVDNRRAIEQEINRLEDERIKALVDESLRMGGLRDGVRAFFLEMQEQAEKASQIIYNTLNSSLDKASANLAKMATEKAPKGGWGAEWGKTFQEIGEQQTQASIKSLAQRGLGALSEKIFGKDLLGHKADGSEGAPFWVKIKDGGAHGTTGGAVYNPSRNLDDIGGPNTNSPNAPWSENLPWGQPASQSVSGYSGGGWLGKLIKIMGGNHATQGDVSGGGGGVSPTDPDFGGFMAEGGDVYPGNIYAVGEKEMEFFSPGVRGSITPASKMGGGGDFHQTNIIDARNADLGASNRLARALEASKRAATSDAVRANHERSNRVPGGR